MGSRAIAVIAENEEVAARRFGIGAGSVGVVYTRTGRPFFAGPHVYGSNDELVRRLRAAVQPLFASLRTDWLALDAELLPWSAKALEPITTQYAAYAWRHGTHCPRHSTPWTTPRLAGWTSPISPLRPAVASRTPTRSARRTRRTAVPSRGLDGVTIAPFQILAAEGRALALAEPHPWHLAELGRLTDEFLTPARHRVVDVSSPVGRDAATAWWLELTDSGGEGMVVKPADPRL